MEYSELRFQKGLPTRTKEFIRERHTANLDIRDKKPSKSRKKLQAIKKAFSRDFIALAGKKKLMSFDQLRDSFKLSIAQALLKRSSEETDAQVVAPFHKKYKAAFLKEFEQHRDVKELQDKFSNELMEWYRNYVREQSGAGSGMVTEINEEMTEGLVENAAFTPPYAFSEAHHDFNINQVKQVVAEWSSGFVSIVAEFEESRGSGSILLDSPTLLLEASMGVGVNYQMPAAGALRVTVVAINTQSHLESTIRDEWGFSDAEVDLQSALYVDVLHTNDWGHSELKMSHLHISSDGDGTSGVADYLLTGVPYVVTLNSTGAFAEGESVQIVVGSLIRTLTYTNDMIAYNKIKVSWQIKSILVEVV